MLSSLHFHFRNIIPRIWCKRTHCGKTRVFGMPNLCKFVDGNMLTVVTDSWFFVGGWKWVGGGRKHKISQIREMFITGLSWFVNELNHVNLNCMKTASLLSDRNIYVSLRLRVQNGVSRLISTLCVNCLISIPCTMRKLSECYSEYSRLNHLDVYLV